MIFIKEVKTDPLFHYGVYARDYTSVLWQKNCLKLGSILLKRLPTYPYKI